MNTIDRVNEGYRALEQSLDVLRAKNRCPKCGAMTLNYARDCRLCPACPIPFRPITRTPRSAA